MATRLHPVYWKVRENHYCSEFARCFLPWEQWKQARASRHLTKASVLHTHSYRFSVLLHPPHLQISVLYKQRRKTSRQVGEKEFGESLGSLQCLLYQIAAGEVRWKRPGLTNSSTVHIFRHQPSCTPAVISLWWTCVTVAQSIFFREVGLLHERFGWRVWLYLGLTKLPNKQKRPIKAHTFRSNVCCRCKREKSAVWPTLCAGDGQTASPIGGLVEVPSGFSFLSCSVNLTGSINIHCPVINDHVTQRERKKPRSKERMFRGRLQPLLFVVCPVCELCLW